MSSTPEKAQKSCLYKLSISKNGSYFREPGVKLRDFQPLFKAVKVPAGVASFKTVKDYALDGEPLFFVDPGLKQAAVNVKAFTDLKRADAPRLYGKEVILGKTLPALRKVYDGGKLVRFLLTSQIVLTYFHISADLCAEESVTKKGAHTTTFRASHLYYTNKKNVDHYRFSITIEPDGTMKVKGLSR